MKKSFLLSVKEWMAKRSSTPWACFETAGPDRKGGMEFSVRWNSAFVNNLVRHGFEGDSEEEIVHMFFLATRVLPEELLQGQDVVNPSATPRLSSEVNALMK